jgi:hypothetical protein
LLAVNSKINIFTTMDKNRNKLEIFRIVGFVCKVLIKNRMFELFFVVRKNMFILIT